jgi:hypothetical protein
VRPGVDVVGSLDRRESRFLPHREVVGIAVLAEGKERKLLQVSAGLTFFESWTEERKSGNALLRPRLSTSSS